ncbi:MAG: cytochrome C oxidase subunit IV family protein [Opitutales bacterium]
MSTTTAREHAEPAAEPPADLREDNKMFLIAFDIALFLASVTLAEWIIVTLPWVAWLVAIPLIVLSVLKFVGVVVWFMHLRWDHKLCSFIFVGGLVLALGTCIALMLLFRSFPHHIPVG